MEFKKVNIMHINYMDNIDRINIVLNVENDRYDSSLIGNVTIIISEEKTIKIKTMDEILIKEFKKIKKEKINEFIKKILVDKYYKYIEDKDPISLIKKLSILGIRKDQMEEMKKRLEIKDNKIVCNLEDQKLKKVLNQMNCRYIYLENLCNFINYIMEFIKSKKIKEIEFLKKI